MNSAARHTKRARRRRRFLIVGIAGLALLAAALGVSFAGPTGTTTLTVSGGATNFVFPVVAGGTTTLPSGVTALKYSTDGDGVTANFQANESPTWTPVSNSAGTVPSSGAGDVVVLNAQDQAILLNWYILDLHELQQAYSSFAFKTLVWQCATGCTTTGAWTQAPTSVVPADGSYLTHTEGFLTFRLPAGKFYVLTIEAGGSFYSTDASNADNNGPEFYFVAQPLA